jgi:hypothetical protein
MRTTPEYTARLVRDFMTFSGRRYFTRWRVRFYQNVRASWWRKRNRREVAA